MYQALYRKWRPHTFGNVVGQSHITNTFKRQVATGRLSHAYLFIGTRGTGRTTCAKILVRAVSCEHPVDGNPCSQRPSCLGIESGSTLDVLELDAASNNGVDQVHALRDETVYVPAVVHKRVYIAGEVRMPPTAAFNALLRILEEPSEHLMFTLATTELHKVPATIKPRCQQFSFKWIFPGDIATRLAYVTREEGIELRGEGVSLLARLVDGGLRSALSLLDQCAGPPGPIREQEVLDVLGLAGNLEMAWFMEQFGGGDTARVLEILTRLYGAGKDVSSLLGELSASTRDLLIRKTAPQGGAALLTGGCDENMMCRLSSQSQTARLVQMLGLSQTIIADLSHSGNRRMGIELCLTRLCGPGLDESTAALGARLARVKGLLAGGIPAVCAVPGQLMKQSALAKWGPSTPRTEPVPIERPPLEEERPPLLDEPGERVDVDETPEPSAVPEDRLVAGEASTGGKAGRNAVADLWLGLAAAVWGRFLVVYPFLNNPAMVQGRLEDGVLTLWVKDEFTKSMVGGASILEELGRPTSAQTGVSACCAVKVGKAPTAPAVAAPAQVAEHDELDDPPAFSRQFDNVIIQE